MKALWNNEVIAESNDTYVIEGNHYFPPESVKEEYIRPSDKHTLCPWKGTASYYHIEANGAVNEDAAAWYYPATKDAAKPIEGYVAFWRGVTFEK